jgi:DNA modification methylase
MATDIERCRILVGDCRAVLPTLEPQSVQTCVTSPPYWGLRDYGTAQWEGGDAGCDRKERDCRRDADRDTRHTDGRNPLTQSDCSLPAFRQFASVCGKCGARRIDAQLGLESTPEDYIANMVVVFREVWRVLRDDGTLWLNLGDSYANTKVGNTNGTATSGPVQRPDYANAMSKMAFKKTVPFGLKPKDLCMMPARVALALQADGWYLRSDIIWHKPNPMPESVTDRPTTSHEHIFLLAKQERYFYDVDAIREPQETLGETHNGKSGYREGHPSKGGITERSLHPFGRNKRTVWTIATQPFSEAHFATFPEEIPKLCILAGSKLGDTILDPFAGSGTVGQVALELGRRAILIELNPAYIELAQDRTFVTPGFL